MKSLRTVHFIVGIAGVILFLLSGQYMRHVLGGLAGMEAGQRMLFRSAHIYLLWSSLLNLLLGCYLVRLNKSLVGIVQSGASAAILISPALLCFAFLYEPYMHGLARPFAFAAIVAAFVGSGLHAMVSLYVARLDARQDRNKP